MFFLHLVEDLCVVVGGVEQKLMHERGSYGSGDCQGSKRDHLSSPLCSAAQIARKLLLCDGRGSGGRRDHRREEKRGVEEAEIGELCIHSLPISHVCNSQLPSSAHRNLIQIRLEACRNRSKTLELLEHHPPEAKVN